MEVKSGYKQTEVGVIPMDWEVKRIGDVVDTDPENLGNNTNPDLVFNYIALEDVDRGFLRSHSEQLFATAPSRARRKLRLDDVLVSTVRPNLQSHLLFRREDGNWICSTGFCVVRCQKGVTHPGYVFFHLFANCVNRQIEALLTGSNYPAINSGDVRALEIPFPAYNEQAAIAEALSDADAFIESLEQLLVKKRQLKQAAMQQLLTGKKRLPGFSGDWEVKRLGELAEIRSGGTPSTTQPQFWDGDIPWCTPTDVTRLNSFKYLFDTSRKISREGVKSSSAEIIPDNSVVMTSRATIGECAINRVPVSTNQGFKNFTPFENVDEEFLYYLLMTQKQGFITLCGGSTFLEIGKAQLIVFEVCIPTTKAEQTAIAAILSDMDAEIAALEAKLAKARRLKQGMMQELLTGRIQLVHPSRSGENAAC
ncbi:MAG TPA: restriction endonuclease subunit S [Nitrospira sp.]|nr:restriction endonuclease subunit S [Nitrospira sp.]